MTTSSAPVLQCGQSFLDLSSPQIMGVLNVTPDSFSDGGELFTAHRIDIDALCRRADAMVTSGAAILDVGGESTRPGAKPVGVDEELSRVVPAIEALVARFECVISIDTSSPDVMREGAAAGAGMINDVRALQRPGALDTAAATGLPVVLMHMQGAPETMQEAPRYGDVVDEVSGFLSRRAHAAQEAGIPREQIMLDPGFGFGKTVAHNFTLLNRLSELVPLGFPLVAGLSRKSMIAKVIADPADRRMPASVTLAVLAAERGARILRVHDVAPTRDGLAMLAAMERGDA